MTDRDRDVLERCAAVIVDVSELPDRNSPADEPDMMLVTGDELRTIVMRHFALDLPITSAEDGPQLECLATLAADLNTMNSRSNAAAVKWAVARLRALTSAREVTDEMVEHALQARVPGGSEVQDWFRPIGPKLLREIIEVALRAALASAPQPEKKGEGQ